MWAAAGLTNVVASSKREKSYTFDWTARKWACLDFYQERGVAERRPPVVRSEGTTRETEMGTLQILNRCNHMQRYTKASRRPDNG